MDLQCLHFPTSLQVKRLAPKGKQMRMDHPFILGFCQHVTFDMVFTISLHIFLKKTLSILMVLCISDSNMADPPNSYFKIELLFQNRIVISKAVQNSAR